MTGGVPHDRELYLPKLDFQLRGGKRLFDAGCSDGSVSRISVSRMRHARLEVISLVEPSERCDGEGLPSLTSDECLLSEDMSLDVVHGRERMPGARRSLSHNFAVAGR